MFEKLTSARFIIRPARSPGNHPHQESQRSLSEKLIAGVTTSKTSFLRMTEGLMREQNMKLIGNDGRFRLAAYKKISLPTNRNPIFTSVRAYR